MANNRSSRRDLMREQLAHHAARLMAEDGITDYAFAKRKAARQMGAVDTRHMPSNDEIDAALHSYRTLYQHDSHPDILHQLRQEAHDAMDMLKPFRPYLTGSVLSGTAGTQSDINLIIYSDDAKAIMMYLLGRQLPFESGEWKINLAGRPQAVPGFTLHSESGIPVHLTILPENARHSSRRAETLADLNAVEALLRNAAPAPSAPLAEDTAG
jgi:hypothetical protein